MRKIVTACGCVLMIIIIFVTYSLDVAQSTPTKSGQEIYDELVQPNPIAQIDPGLPIIQLKALSTMVYITALDDVADYLDWTQWGNQHSPEYTSYQNDIAPLKSLLQNPTYVPYLPRDKQEETNRAYAYVTDSFKRGIAQDKARFTHATSHSERFGSLMKRIRALDILYRPIIEQLVRLKATYWLSGIKMPDTLNYVIGRAAKAIRDTGKATIYDLDKMYAIITP